ncbi:NYN domain-containing protein [Candidatus Manganitrophus noduliformans]|uniref:NYN domain-containing protein n=1 Tax=Candidatus Manganitrophus noduliformans TaxID=2606439 RepID=A0A7X6DMY7_9BACT|nr:NYN domain-containing protein [Candidatus Manganitrophus noduliformans]NKE70072.1 NYN domain-containing protein [Candidatus Manganitrophus noduliformans]
MHLIIDGYNFIGRQKGLRGDLEGKRARLIEQLTAYRQIKNLPVTVVFDGSAKGAAERTGGIEVIFSGYGESADDVIVRMAEDFREGCTVVSSDRAVRDQAQRSGAVALYSGEFETRLHAALHQEGTPPTEKPLDETEPPRPAEKKGNPRKLSKTERRRQGRLKRL